MRGRLPVGAALAAMVVLGAPVAASPYSTFVIDETGPVFYWNLDGHARDLVPDTSGVNNGIRTFQAAWGAEGPRPPDVANLPPTNAALRLDGQNDTVIYDRALDGFDNTGGAGIGTAAYSVQAWFTSAVPFTDKIHSYVLGRGDFKNQTNYHGWSKDSVGVGGWYNPTLSNKLFFFDGDAGSGAVAVGSTTLQPNTWYHTVFVRDNDDIRVYLNGQPEISATIPWAGGDGDVIAVGGRADYVNIGQLNLNGRVDEVAAWDRALSDAEVAKLFGSMAPYVVWTEDFESGLGRWTVGKSTPGGTMEIAPDPAQGDQALHMDTLRGSPGNRFEAYAVVNDPVFDAWIDTQPYTVEFDLLIPDADHHWFYAYVDERLYTTINTNGMLSYLAVGTPYTVVNVAPLSIGQWHSLRYEVFPLAELFDIYVDGAYIRTGSFWNWEGGTMPDEWRPFLVGDRPTPNDDWGEAYWDNFRITFAVPEPATALLLGSGLAALLRRRRTC